MVNLGKMSHDMEKNLTKLKQEVKGVLLSCPSGITLQAFLKDYKLSVGRSFPYYEFGYKSESDFLKSMDDVLIFQTGSRSIPSQLIPLVSSKVNHINDMVRSQKQTNKKMMYYNPPRRAVTLPKENEATNSQNLAESVKVFIDAASQHQNGLRPSRGRGKTSASSAISPLPVWQNVNHSTPRHEDERPVEDVQYNDFGKSEDNICGYEMSLEDEERYHPTDEYLDRPPTPTINFSDKFKENIRSIILEHPGLPASKLCSLYLEKFKYKLNFSDYGYRNIKELIAVLPDIIQYEQLSTDWILYDATEPKISPKETTTKWIPRIVQEKIEKLALENPSGIEETYFYDLYKAKYDEVLLFETFDIETLEDLIRCCRGVKYQINGDILTIYPNNTVPVQTSPAMPTSRPLPATSDLDDMWRKYFRHDECDPTMSFKQLPLPPIDKLNYAWVVVCDCFNPQNMWLQLADNQSDLDKLMLELNEFYNENEARYVMNPSCIFQEGICTVRFIGDKRWHRAKVLSIESDRSVKVLYVDYGSQNTVNLSDLRKLKKEFHELPAQAFNVSLHNLTYAPGKTEWDMESIEFLYNHTIYQKFKIQVFGTPRMGEKMDVILHCFDDDKPSLNDLLLSHKLAYHVGMVPAKDAPPRPVVKKSSDAGSVRLSQNNASAPSVTKTVNKSSDQDIPKRVRTPPGYSSRSSVSQESTSNHDMLTLIEEMKRIYEHQLLVINKSEESITSLLKLMHEIKDSQQALIKISIKMAELQHSHYKPEHPTLPEFKEVASNQEVGGGNRHRKHGPVGFMHGNSHSQASQMPLPPSQITAYPPREQFVPYGPSMYQGPALQAYPGNNYMNYPMRPGCASGWAQQVQPYQQMVRQMGVTHSSYPPGYNQMAGGPPPGCQGQPMIRQMQPHSGPQGPFGYPHQGYQQPLNDPNCYQQIINGSVQHLDSLPLIKLERKRRDSCSSVSQRSQSNDFNGYQISEHSSGGMNHHTPSAASCFCQEHLQTPREAEPGNDIPPEISSIPLINSEEQQYAENELEGPKSDSSHSTNSIPVQETIDQEASNQETINIVEQNPENPTRKLLELIAVDDEFRENPIMNNSMESAASYSREPSNLVMKIRVSGADEPMYLLLLPCEFVKPLIVLSLHQLYKNFSRLTYTYEEFCTSLQNTNNPIIPIHSSDYAKIFEFLRSVNYAGQHDESALVVSLSEIPLVLDLMIPISEMAELPVIKQIFMNVSEELTPDDSFWWSESLSKSS